MHASYRSSHAAHPAPSSKPLPYGKGGASLSRGTASQPHRVSKPQAHAGSQSPAPSARPIPAGYRHAGRAAHADGVGHMAPSDGKGFSGANVQGQSGYSGAEGHFAKHGNSGGSAQAKFDAGI